MLLPCFDGRWRPCNDLDGRTEYSLAVAPDRLGDGLMADSHSFKVHGNEISIRHSRTDTWVGCLNVAFDRITFQSGEAWVRIADTYQVSVDMHLQRIKLLEQFGVTSNPAAVPPPTGSQWRVEEKGEPAKASGSWTLADWQPDPEDSVHIRVPWFCMHPMADMLFQELETEWRETAGTVPLRHEPEVPMWLYDEDGSSQCRSCHKSMSNNAFQFWNMLPPRNIAVTAATAIASMRRRSPTRRIGFRVSTTGATSLTTSSRSGWSLKLPSLVRRHLDASRVLRPGWRLRRWPCTKSWTHPPRRHHRVTHLARLADRSLHRSHHWRGAVLRRVIRFA